MKNKKGFTLAEILLVVAIIAILSGATLVGVSSLVNNSKATASKVQNDAQNFELAAASKVKGAAGNVPSNPVETETLNTKPSNPTPSESQKPADPSTPAINPTKDPSGSKPSESQPAGTTAPTSATSPSTPPSQGGGNHSGSTTLNGSQFNKQANTTITGNGQGIDSITINVPEGVKITAINDASNGGRYKVSVSADGRTATISFDPNAASWASRDTKLNVNCICWDGPTNVDITYDIKYA